MRHTPAPGAADLQRRPADRLLTAIARHRRGGRRVRALRRIAALLLLLAAAVVATAGPAPPGDGTAVPVAARDLPAGATLGASDVRTAVVRSPPDGALTGRVPAGQVLAGPVRRGEILTDARLLTGGGPRPGPGRAAVPIRPDDAGTVALLRPGMRVAVIGVGADGVAHTLTDDAVVLWVPPEDGVTGAAARAGRLVVLSVPAEAADRIAAVGITGSIGVRFA